MKKICFTITLFLISGLLICKAQEITWVYRPGQVTFKDGTKVSGQVRIYDDGDSPWYNQRFIWFIDSASYAGNPNIKGRINEPNKALIIPGRIPIIIYPYL